LLLPNSILPPSSCDALSLPQRKLWHAFQTSVENSSLSLKSRKSKILLIQVGFVVLKILIAGGGAQVVLGPILKTRATLNEFSSNSSGAFGHKSCLFIW
jgi:alpha-D-ribose 1-methylphosphonate 5-triphosphate synthase subunit PhnG